MSKAKDAKSPRIKRAKVEADVERFRAEGNLCKALDHANFLNDRGSTKAYLYQLVYVEHLLELIDKDEDHQHLHKSHDPSTPMPMDRASRLQEAEKNLSEVMRCLPTDGVHRYALQGNILQGKLLYLQGKYQEAWDFLEALKLDEQSIESQASSLTKLMAEAFAIIGLSLEGYYRSSLAHQTINKANVSPSQINQESGSDESTISKIIQYFELAGDLCIYHMQELEKTAGQTTSTLSGNISSANLLAPGMPKVVETAIQRSPIMHIQRGELNKAVDRFRQLLNYNETSSTQPIRQTLTRQFAEVLLRGICSGNYHRYAIEVERNTAPPVSQSQRRPRQCRPSCYPSDRFIPDDHVQEAVLMLLISEYIANRSAILNRSPELAEARIRTFYNTTAVYDLLAIALVRKGCFHFLASTLEHSLKFSYNEFHIWMQFALSLISAGKYHRAYLVLKECLRIDPQHIACHIQAAILCYQHLHLITEGLEWSQKLLKLFSPSESSSSVSSTTFPQSNASRQPHGDTNSTPWNNLTVADFGSPLRGRAHLLCGWGKSLLTKQCRLLERRRELQAEAITHYMNATKYDSQDHLTWYHLALERACQRNVDAAKQAIQQALRLCPSHSHSLHLLALIHTSSGDWAKAWMILDAAMADHPKHMGLLLTKAKVEAVLHGNKKALACYKKLLEVWRDSFGSDYDTGAFLERLRQPTTSQNSTVTSAGGNIMAHSMINNNVNSMNVPTAIILDTSDRASSVSGATLPRMGSATGVDCVDWYRSEQRASTWLATISGSQCPGANQSANVGHFCLMESTESGASYNNFATLPGAPVHLAQDAWSSLGYGRGPLSWLTKILLDLACLYLDMSSLTEALNCIEEAATATQMCPAIVYLRGRYLEHLEMWREAKKLYEGVLSMCPEHVEVRQRLARILLDLGQIELAEKILRDAISIDASSCTTWQLLGETLQMMNQREGAKHCLMVSLDLECTQPLVDFQELPRGIGSACV